MAANDANVRQILAAAFPPLVVLAVAGFGLLSTYTAMWIAMWLLVGELGVIAFLACAAPNCVGGSNF